MTRDSEARKSNIYPPSGLRFSLWFSQGSAVRGTGSSQSSFGAGLGDREESSSDPNRLWKRGLLWRDKEWWSSEEADKLFLDPQKEAGERSGLGLRDLGRV